ncbi:DUF362 domain-containing protein [Eubacteriales bacterium OttesenSCG-928-N14]|nr:DUF362 domain-containing protein [Eubacteriales bacterium OttesenSCG-928-N14]
MKQNSIYINYGDTLQQMTFALLSRAEVALQLRPDMHVLIKPNLVIADAPEGGATTHVGIVEGIVQYLQQCGITNITIGESSWVGLHDTMLSFERCGYTALAKRYGVALLDFKRDASTTLNHDGMDIAICNAALAADYLINVPVLKGHCQTGMTCCLKNLKGCIPDHEKRNFHSKGLHRPIAALAALLRPNLHVVDGICGDLNFEEGGNPVQAGRILLGTDGVLLDSYGAHLMGFSAEEIAHVALAHRHGVGQLYDANTEIIELNADARPQTVQAKRGTVAQLARHIDEDAACSACYASLIHALYRMNTGKLSGKIHIGQGYRGRQVNGIGVGNCTAGCSRYLPGCPPSAADILRFLQSQ